MKVTCPDCGKEIVVNGLGRKALNIPLKNICERLRACKDICAAANQLGCSQGYIYNALKAKGLKVKDIINN
jgi:hypothetical protein